jgi:hypothetical protein
MRLKNGDVVERAATNSVSNLLAAAILRLWPLN